jgi:hypothetical protein
METNIAEQVIEAFGGLTKMSKQTGWPIPTIQGWQRSGRIPAWRRDPIIDLALSKNIALPDGFVETQSDEGATA